MDESLKKMDDLPQMNPRHRKEGFPGQHHVVLPLPVVEAARGNPLLQGLFVTDAGLYPHAKGHYVSRKDGVSGHILIICTSGQGWVKTRGQHQDVKAGSLFFIGENESHSYGAAIEDPWTIEWVHFFGNEAPFWRETIVKEGFILHLPAIAISSVGLSGVFEHLEAGYDEAQLLLASVALRKSLTELVKFRRVPGHTLTSVESVEATADWLKAHLANQITLPTLAQKAGMSPSQYSAIFRQRFGFSPIDWFIRQRVQQACHLLDLTQHKVEVVGLEVGFRDPYYFSRCFRRVMGCSPRAYRAITKG